ncbi:MAG: hypothetical protein IPH05_14585 [Flavobacteriales bacterium]|nr:hypothetical protein [Flavobacteriales bacterium]MBK6884140.1 hypothetical protein [Flavobacteriales bacterium]MBK7100519.1 hypothetical protein [Flavobacteriales bacterium]MBK7111216.1 hypothetical protein [Flavobacteriales bacterium]MBK7484425.1 hypothetical protein [Flavobacteriales bacterium]
MTQRIANKQEGVLDLGSTPSGVYVLSLIGSGTVVRRTVVRE